MFKYALPPLSPSHFSPSKTPLHTNNHPNPRRHPKAPSAAPPQTPPAPQTPSAATSTNSNNASPTWRSVRNVSHVILNPKPNPNTHFLFPLLQPSGTNPPPNAAVIAVLHGISFGLALDLSLACDIRLSTTSTRFSVKEVDIGLAADIGTLSRLPKAVGNSSWVKEICLTARIFGGEEAQSVGLVSGVYGDKSEAVQEVSVFCVFV